MAEETLWKCEKPVEQVMREAVGRDTHVGCVDCESELGLSRRRFIKKTGALAAGVAGVSAMDLKDSMAQEDGPGTRSFTIHSIGTIVKRDKHTTIVLDKKYVPGLLRMEKLSHVTVVYWFDRNDTPEKRAILQVHPRGKQENPLTGVFATHSPVRPNLIAISRCKIRSVKDNIIEIAEIDAFDNTPVIDLKS